jgi:predicted transposase YbfD/YdcC
MEETVTSGRLELRETYLYIRQDNPDKGWESIRLIAYVHRNFLTGHREHKTDSFYVSGLQTVDAKHIAGGIRSHRHIENRLHYTKDVIMREDAECTANRNAAASLALLRDFAFNILKSKNRPVKQATEIFANCHVSAILDMLIRT